MGTTALQILTASFFDCGIIGEGESLSAATAQDGLRRLNNMVAGWRTQFGTVLSIERTIFPITANQQTYTIGLGGEFNVPRPVTITGAGLWYDGLASPHSVTSITRSGLTATVTQTAHGFAVGDEAFIAGAAQIAYNGLQTVQTVPSANTYTFALDETTPVSPATGTLTAAAVNGQPVEIPAPVITDAMYQFNQLKSLTNSQFTTVYYNPTAGPLGTLVLWPKPNTAINQLVLYLQNAFTGFADLTTAYDYPDLPGYAESLQYNFDLRLITPYAVKDPDVLAMINKMATDTLMLVKRANNKLTDLPTDARVLAHNGRGGYNIQSGNY